MRLIKLDNTEKDDKSTKKITEYNISIHCW